MGHRAMDIHGASYGVYIEQGAAEELHRDRLVDKSKDWPEHEFAGHWLRLRGGSNDDAIAVVRDNNANTLFFEHDLASEPSNPPGTSYFVYAHMHRDAYEAAVVEVLNSIASSNEEILVVLKQIRYGIGQLTSQDLKNVDPDN